MNPPGAPTKGTYRGCIGAEPNHVRTADTTWFQPLAAGTLPNPGGAKSPRWKQTIE